MGNINLALEINDFNEVYSVLQTPCGLNLLRRMNLGELGILAKLFRVLWPTLKWQRVKTEDTGCIMISLSLLTAFFAGSYQCAGIVLSKRKAKK